ncbi:MAG: histidine kinase [Pseudoflavonifractor sp.]
MFEILDNALQFLTVLLCTGWAGLIAVRRKSQSYAILTCFYGSFALGSLYWLIYLLMMTYTPKIFYVSDLSWVASFLFLLTLELSIRTEEEKHFHSPLAWLSCLIVLGLTVYFCVQWGDYIITLLWGGFLAGCAYVATNGLLYARRQNGAAHKRGYLHGAVLLVIAVEHILWLLSPFCTGDRINPYFLCDLVLTAALALLLPAMKRAVDVA